MTRPPLRILVVHNRYREPGGEDAVVAAETALLRAQGHTVVEYSDDNRATGLGTVAAAAQAVWSGRTRRRLTALLRANPVDIAHFHNTFFRISPSAYQACHDAGVAVVQTLHNYRLACPAATFYRAGQPCEDCLGRLPWPGVLHACYRASRAQTALVAVTVSAHRLLGTWRSAIDLYVATTHFQRTKLVAAGLPEERVVIKPHFVDPDPGPRSGAGEYALYVGRLSAEKGVRTLLDAWAHLPDVPLKIAGDGPQADLVRGRLANQALPKVEWLGRVPRDSVLALLRRARFLVFPSDCYETFGIAIVEAFACGVPVIAARQGAMAELIADEKTGLLFAPRDAGELARTVGRAWSDRPTTARLGQAARAEYQARYTAARNYELLSESYSQALERFSAR